MPIPTLALFAVSTGVGTLFLVLFAGALGRYLDREAGLLHELALFGAFGGFLLSIIRRGLVIASAQAAQGDDPGGTVALYVAATDSLMRVYAEHRSARPACHRSADPWSRRSLRTTLANPAKTSPVFATDSPLRLWR